MSDSKPNSSGFHLHIDKFNEVYKRFDQTHDDVRDTASQIMETSDGLSSAKIGGQVQGVVAGAHAGLTRLRDGNPDTVHGALRALQYRNAHLLNGMYDSLEAYNNTDQTHAQGIANSSTVSGRGTDPGRRVMLGHTNSSVQHQDLSGIMPDDPHR